jgi:hypothetical protein
MVCNLGQDTFIDYLISECGLGQVTWGNQNAPIEVDLGS